MDNNQRPLIFISNDDGVNAKGIRALIEYVSDLGDIFVAAPDTPQSGQSSSITIETPLRATQMPNFMGATIYQINGTPVDCVKLSRHALLPRRPDFIISGINHGSNSGNSAIYSGTMGIVFEGCMIGVPSIGFSFLSHEDDADFSPCRPIVRKIMKKVMKSGLPEDVCLNVNIPSITNIKGIKVAVAARGGWTEEFVTCEDPRGRNYYWLTGRYINHEPDNKLTDLHLLNEGYATVVPCRPDQTAKNALSIIDEILSDKD